MNIYKLNAIINNIALTSYDSFRILGVIVDSMFTFDKHIYSISSAVAQKISLKKSFKIVVVQGFLLQCFSSFIISCMEYCPVRAS